MILMEKKKVFNSGIVIVVILMVIGIWSFDNEVQYEKLSNTTQPEKISTGVFLPHYAYAQTGGNTSISDVAEKSVESVVNISSTKVISTPRGEPGSPFLEDPFFKRFFGPNFRFDEPSERRQKSLGSGVIISKDGIILTNNHVIQDAEEIKVVLHDESEFDGEVIGTDPQSDLAVIRLKGSVKDLKPLSFGDSDALRLGETVLAIGSPFGLSQTVTMGIVSAKGRSEVRLVDYENFIQTDAAINPGNSGGALINLKGELVGINTALASKSGGYEGIGFAIPSTMAKMIMNSLIDHGKVARGWLGVGIQDISQDIAEAMNLSTTQGVLITDVFEDSPAEKSGLQSGDIIIRVDDEEMETRDQLRNRIALLGPDKKITLIVLRKGKEKEITVKLSERTDEVRQVAVSRGRKGEKEDTVNGLTVAPLNDTARSQYKIPEDVDYGIVIIQVKTGSKADDAGLQAGDVIREINNRQIVSVDIFRDEYRKADRAVLLYIYRNGGHFFKGLKK